VAGTVALKFAGLVGETVAGFPGGGNVPGKPGFPTGGDVGGVFSPRFSTSTNISAFCCIVGSPMHV